MYDLGDVWTGTIEVRDLTDALTDSTVVLNITLPDQTVAGPFTPTRDLIGQYHYDYTTAQPGRHVARWVGTSATFAHTAVFDVEPAADISIVSLGDVKRQLSLTGTDDDDELRSYLLSATESIETMCGPCAVRAFTERVNACGERTLRLAYVPVVSLTNFIPVYSNTPGLATADVTVDPQTGAVTRLDGGRFRGVYDVATVAGRPLIPASIRLACSLIVQHLWETRRGPVGVSPAGDEMVTMPGWGYAIPNRAAELLGGFRHSVFVA